MVGDAIAILKNTLAMPFSKYCDDALPFQVQD